MLAVFCESGYCKLGNTRLRTMVRNSDLKVILVNLVILVNQVIVVILVNLVNLVIPMILVNMASGDSFCTLFTIFHSVQHFVHYLYTIEAVHY